MMATSRSLPFRLSRSLRCFHERGTFLFARSMNSSRSIVINWALSLGRKTHIESVFMDQPRILSETLRVPSARSFARPRIGGLSTGSSGDDGQNRQ